MVLVCYQVMWKCKVKNSRLERMTKIPIFNVLLIQINLPKKILMLNHSRPNLLSHDCHIHEDESLLKQFERNVRARQSTSSVPPVLSSEAVWHSVRIAWNLLVCRVTKEKGWCRSELSCDCGHVLRILKTSGLQLRHPGLVLVLR